MTEHHASMRFTNGVMAMGLLFGKRETAEICATVETANFLQDGEQFNSIVSLRMFFVVFVTYFSFCRNFVYE
jgi:hypothetical protein